MDDVNCSDIYVDDLDEWDEEYIEENLSSLEYWDDYDVEDYEDDNR